MASFALGDIFFAYVANKKASSTVAHGEITAANLFGDRMSESRMAFRIAGKIVSHSRDTTWPFARCSGRLSRCSL